MMYTAEQISELIQALRKCKEAACNSCKYECCQDITVDAADALTAITAENEALTHERDKLSKLLKAECAISNSHNDTIARLQAELAALRAKYEPVCPSCGLQNNRFTINRAEVESLQAQLAEVTQTRDDYATAASAISLWLKEFCDNSLTYDQMIADAARKAANALSESRERERAAVRDMKAMALAMRESEELTEGCCFACAHEAQNIPGDVILAYGECPGYERDDCFKWRGDAAERSRQWIMC